jgi:hypothetical protein
MAFFEFLNTVYEAVGDLFKPVGGRAMESFDPDPVAMVPWLGGGEGDMVTLDSAGHLHVRGPIMTDEGGFRDDFSGTSLTTTLTGTVTFTNGSTSVTGSGTAFLSELNRDNYVRLSAHADSTAARIATIVSDTELTLEEDYTGANGSGAAVKSFWVQSITGSATVAVASGNVTLGTGTASGNIGILQRDVDYQPITGQIRLSVSQRIANQQLCVGFADSADTQRACVTFDGTVNTTAKFKTWYSTAAVDQQETTFTLPLGLTTATPLTYQVVVSTFAVCLIIEGVEVARHTLHIPGMYQELRAYVRVENTGVAASNTNLAVDVIGISNQNLLQVASSFRSDPINTVVADEGHYLTGNLTTTTTTADQVICSTTVPAGKVLYITGYSISVGTGADGNPVRIGRNPPISDVGAPGLVDSPLFVAVVVTSTGQREHDSYAANPIPIGRGGDVVAMTVTPAATTTTLWRGSITYVLRGA